MCISEELIFETFLESEEEAMRALLPLHLANLQLIDHRVINLSKNNLKIYINFLLKATYVY